MHYSYKSRGFASRLSLQRLQLICSGLEDFFRFPNIWSDFLQTSYSLAPHEISDYILDLIKF